MKKKEDKKGDLLLDEAIKEKYKEQQQSVYPCNRELSNLELKTIEMLAHYVSFLTMRSRLIQALRSNNIKHPHMPNGDTNTQKTLLLGEKAAITATNYATTAASTTSTFGKALYSSALSVYQATASACSQFSASSQPQQVLSEQSSNGSLLVPEKETLTPTSTSATEISTLSDKFEAEISTPPYKND